ncbi:hypothetical protein IC762_26200 [Bradyrhizobium genosp. L]|uniref:hypothetical protein n=1 Tax=Bradyrhizobium genosp. L TaxID=83637 RepID=UPI0018A2A62B|nr:hypothetical protein [Bradyrhizobium genosp. L]QPF83188.1 hypothetical protein IC762_26200 [Bradyrhizobium genosp. L]
MPRLFGAKIYNNQAYKDAMNKNYFPLSAMKTSVATLQASSLIHMDTMEYGQYQPILTPLNTWPNGAGAFWMKEMGLARLDLTNQPNSTPLSQDEPTVIPLTRCALLDACIRKCFNSTPDPIPMIIDIVDLPAGETVHQIKLVWEYQDGSDRPTLLRFTMCCPPKFP